MATKLPMDDPENIWQNQTTEPFRMSLDQLRQKAQERQEKARCAALFSIIMGTILCIFFAWGFATAAGMLLRMGFGVLSLWCLYFSYQAYRWTWPVSISDDASLSTTVQAYRSELENRRDYGRKIWRKAGLSFCCLGLGLIVVPELVRSLQNSRLLLNVMPVCVLFAIWLFAFFPARRRKLRKLQQEIDELREFENQGRA